MFDKFRRASAAARMIEEQLYEQVAHELSHGERREGLWTKALASADGIETKAKALYIRFRVQAIKDEMQIHEAMRDEELKAALTKLTDPSVRARDFGLTEDEILYLGTPIEALHYEQKFRTNRKKISKAISLGRLRGVICRGVLWVEDKNSS